jgi:protein-disulfide isomerase
VALAAEFEGGRITMEELDARIGPDAEDLLRVQYEQRRNAIGDLLTERLVEAEARRRGLTTEQLLDVEVRQRVPEPEPEELEEFYRRYPERFENDTKETAHLKIADALFKARAQRLRDAFAQRLRESADVKLFIEPPRVDLVFDDEAPRLGPEDAPVTIVEFADYECPYCRAVQETVDDVMQRYAGQVRLVYRDLPLEQHPRARDAARAARCAREQDRFWEYHRDLLISPDELSAEQLGERAARLGLDRETFEACLASDRHDEAIDKAIEESKAVSVRSTPTFFVNGRRIRGAISLAQFMKLIDEELETLD